ncbi:MAG TPA: hypothetical protein VFQ45_06500 [Longimicrobium sp.]|nr:hypothetical protein [Longimicrobium sp.]
MEDESLARFSARISSLVAAAVPVSFAAEFSPLRDNSTERVWFVFLLNHPPYQKLDIHVQTRSAAVGSDSRLGGMQLRDLAARRRIVLHDPDELLETPLPPRAVPPEHAVAVLGDLLATIGATFGLLMGPLWRGDYWASLSHLDTIRRDLIYALALERDTEAVGDNYLKRLAASIAPDLYATLTTARIGADVQSLARIAGTFLTMYEHLCTRVGLVDASPYILIHVAQLRAALPPLASFAESVDEGVAAQRL